MFDHLGRGRLLGQVSNAILDHLLDALDQDQAAPLKVLFTYDDLLEYGHAPVGACILVHLHQLRRLGWLGLSNTPAVHDFLVTLVVHHAHLVTWHLLVMFEVYPVKVLDHKFADGGVSPASVQHMLGGVILHEHSERFLR